MTKANTLPERLARLVEIAGGQKPLARACGVSDAAIIAWRAGSQPMPSTLEAVADHAGLSLAWLRDGAGDDARELRRFSAAIRAKALSTRQEETSRVAEDSPFSSMLPAPLNCRHIIEHLTKSMTPAKITEALADVMRDPRLSPEERRRTGQALSEILTARFAHETETTKRQN